jgi:hypothetical protein
MAKTTAKNPSVKKAAEGKKVTEGKIKKKANADQTLSQRKMNKEETRKGDSERAKIARPTRGKNGLDTKEIKFSTLRGADYNPRVISDTRLRNLEMSIRQFGDLSGIVFNASKKRRVLISGHQRIKSVSGKGWKQQVDLKPHTDEFGTVSIGHLNAVSPEGHKVSIPMRVVVWDDKKCEMAANVAANAHGGDFDKRKLSIVLDELETDVSQFNVNLIGLDPLMVRTLASAIAMEGKSDTHGNSTSAKNGAGGEFREFDDKQMKQELKHNCPRCGFRF